jgi:beta-lactamase regulating signal transducer with metallopeptidase domain
MECGPALLPTIPAKILLPAAWNRWSPGQRRAALHHEWHHSQNHDALWTLLMDFMVATLWIHPSAWLVRSQWREEMEHQADRAALGQLDPDQYASELLQIVRTGHRILPFIGVGFVHSGSANRFRRRLLRLFETPDEAKCSGAITCLAAGLLLATTLLILSCQIRHESSAEMPEETQLRLDANPFPADP